MPRGSLTIERDELRPLPAPASTELPESTGYRWKVKLLGQPLDNDQLEHERLGRPTALAVFASDALSSTAYATEEILRVLVPVIGVMAFARVLPITLAMVVVLVILMFSYRQTIKAYPSAGGAYIVTKDNLGLMPAQIAGVALLTDYILTVAVSVSAGVAALYSAFPVVLPYKVPVALLFIAVIAWGNLRGVKESGRLFALPTYGFLISVLLMILTGLYRATLGGGLEHVPVADPAALDAVGTASVFLLLHAFASGGAAMTGVEAISNGVPAFKPPEWKHARSTLMVMGTCLGIMFVGISWLAMKMHVVPNEEATVISQIAKGVFGEGIVGHGLFLMVQAMTMLILVLAANTSFADFPRLASFHADDAFMPKQLTKRGHRLVFSNGIIALAAAGAVLVVVFSADVTHLIPLYAIGVFTSFTLSQTGMAIRHLRLHEPGWRVGLFINGAGALATGVVTVIIALTKFTHGAWFIMILVPVMVAGLVKLNHQYESEKVDLQVDLQAAARTPILRRHVVLLLVSHLDRSTARAIQYARTLTPDDLRAVHVASDPIAADELVREWADMGLDRISLEVVQCSDRRIARAVQNVVAEAVSDGMTEVSVLVPRREYARLWHRLLHDRTSDSIARVVAALPHANVTFVPYHLGSGPPPASA